MTNSISVAWRHATFRFYLLYQIECECRLFGEAMALVAQNDLNGQLLRATIALATLLTVA